MRAVTLLQLGDLHYDQTDAGPEVDVQDPGISAAVVAAAAPSRLRAVMQKLQRICAADPPKMLAVCGDLSSRGDLSVYAECVAYLDLNLELAAGRFWTAEGIHAVPGNHDVDRSLVDPSGADLFGKFRPLEEAWRNQGIDILRCGSLRHTRVAHAGCEIRAFSVNSCVGCGENRAADFTASLRAELQARADSGDTDAGDALWEGLDTPMIHESHLTSLAAEIGALPVEAMPVVIGHHNVLPQAMPRIKVYTEMLNGGAARARLASQDRWVLYLHGHIHDDPIEVISKRHPGGGNLLAISAPLISHGFNLVRLEFGESGRPLGCVVTRYRYEPGGDVRAQPDVRIPVRQPLDLPHPLVERVLEALPAGKSARFPDLLSALAATTSGQVPTTEELADALQEAEWADRVQISERADEASRWLVWRPAT